MNWRIPGGVLILTGLLVIMIAVEFTLKAIKFRNNSVEVVGRAVISTRRDVVIAVSTPQGTKYLSAPGSRYALKEYSVLVPGEGAHSSAPILKSAWRLFDASAVVGPILLIWGVVWWRRGRE